MLASEPRHSFNVTSILLLGMAIVIPFPKPKSPPQGDGKNEGINCPYCHYVTLSHCDLIAHIGQEHSSYTNMKQ